MIDVALQVHDRHAPRVVRRGEIVVDPGLHRAQEALALAEDQVVTDAERVRVHAEHRAGLLGGLAVLDLRRSAVHDHRAHAEPRGRSRPRRLGARRIVEEERVRELVGEERSGPLRAIGRTPRSNPATYTGCFTPIRELFAQVKDARERGYGPGRFSFNVKGGRCEACQGDGVIKIEMHFLPDVYVQCDVCKGRRYNRETLEVLFRGKSIADVLDMTVDEGCDFFRAVPAIRDKLVTLQRVGLGYIHIGQPATTLSGGEAQRVKLAKELSRRATGRTLYILDEPTTGLHFADVEKLLDVLHALVEQGNTVLVIEHNLEVIKTVDWLLDLGPEGGDGGGHIVATGTPEEVAQVEASYTGQYLRPYLKASAAARRRRTG